MKKRTLPLLLFLAITESFKQEIQALQADTTPSVKALPYIRQPQA